MSENLPDNHEEKDALMYDVEALTAVCQLIAGLYRFPLKEEVIKRLLAIDLQDGEDDFILKHEDCKDGLLLMQEYCKGSDQASLLLKASNDFHALFVGPHRLLAAPWSSVYLDKTGLIFGPTALKVKEIFAINGFEIPEGTKEPSDHIAYEWQFIADLQKRVVEACNDGDDDRMHETVETLFNFVDAYFSTWVKTLCDRILENAETDFYRGLARFSLGLWALEQKLLSDLQSFTKL